MARGSLCSAWRGSRGRRRLVVVGGPVVPGYVARGLAPWVAPSVVAAIMSAGISALLNGLGRIGALAASGALGSVIGTLVFLGAVEFPTAGPHHCLCGGSRATLLVGAMMAWLTYPRGARVSRRLWAPELGRMILLGLAVSSSIILTNTTQLVSRVWVSHELGIDEAGYLQACLAIGAVYLGFVLNALAAEYYPRIAQLGEDRNSSTARRTIRCAWC